MDKIEKVFDEIETRREPIVNTGSLSLISSLGDTNQNSMWNNVTKSINLIEKVKFLGLTLKTKITEIPVDVFFEKLKKSKSEIKIIDGMVEKYISRVDKAEKFGQVALAEKLKDEIEIVKKETLAVVAGVKEYLTQEQVSKLLNKSSKNIEIDYIKNFTRHIPDNLLAKTEKTKGIFDEYVVMHYDPKKKNTELTKKEKEKKRDPILFGIIKHSRNFYYIGDWIDEYCDLTLKEAVLIIEDKPKQI